MTQWDTEIKSFLIFSFLTATWRFWGKTGIWKWLQFHQQSRSVTATTMFHYRPRCSFLWCKVMYLCIIEIETQQFLFGFRSQSPINLWKILAIGRKNLQFLQSFFLVQEYEEYSKWISHGKDNRYLLENAAATWQPLCLSVLSFPTFKKKTSSSSSLFPYLLQIMIVFNSL